MTTNQMYTNVNSSTAEDSTATEGHTTQNFKTSKAAPWAGRAERMGRTPRQAPATGDSLASPPCDRALVAVEGWTEEGERAETSDSRREARRGEAQPAAILKRTPRPPRRGSPPPF